MLSRFSLSRVAAGFLMATAADAAAQGRHSIQDPLGLAVPYPVQSLAQGKEGEPGTTRDMLAHDRFRLFQYGRDLVQRTFELHDGAMARPGELEIPLYVNGSARGEPPYRMRRDHAASCGFCHANPQGQPGSGAIIPSTGPLGRRTPHFYGAGLVEMIGDEIKRQIYLRCDTNRNGQIDLDEAAADCEALVEPRPGADTLSFGRTSFDSSGRPRLNGVVRTWFVDRWGHPVNATSPGDPGVAGYDLAVYLFGWGRGARKLPDGSAHSEGGEASTLREIFVLAANSHMGLRFDDLVQVDPHGQGSGGRAEISSLGKQQYDFGAVMHRPAVGLPLEFGSGDVDAAEFYMLHLPPPVVLAGARVEAGRAAFRAFGCAACHVEQWNIAAGDRRMFRLEPEGRLTSAGESEINLRLIDYLSNPGQRAAVPLTVRDVFSDFRHWDIGERFHEKRYDGTVQTTHRTPPLWGVGSTAPYGHNGRFANLDEVIRAHDAVALPSRVSYEQANDEQRADLLAFLSSLVLYPIDRVPADIDGDGLFSRRFVRDGRALGHERFDPRLLFVPPADIDLLTEMPGPDGYPLPIILFHSGSNAYRSAATTPNAGSIEP